ncbi:hypothetical protein [Pedobacter sp. SYSU D00535]|uniref:hypothetical protein n=1 Tax=Pedobacter sp. SYSU D00535 TaxID=2810308 RepID=UPI001A972A28|nr:hypothetical protein [Pedobacter sp. SYSU D00535]
MNNAFFVSLTMDLIGKYKLAEFIKAYPEDERALSAWLKQDRLDHGLYSPVFRPSFASCSPFGKFQLNYVYNRGLRWGYVHYAGKEHKSIPGDVTMPEIQEDLIAESITIMTGRGRTKTIIERKEVPNKLRDEDYPIPQAEAAKASQRTEKEERKAIGNDKEYKRLYFRALMIFNSEPGTKEYEELLSLLPLIRDYEDDQFRFMEVTLLDVVGLHMEERRYTTDLLALDLGEPFESVKAFLETGAPLSKKGMKKLVKIFRLGAFLP